MRRGERKRVIQEFNSSVKLHTLKQLHDNEGNPTGDGREVII